MQSLLRTLDKYSFDESHLFQGTSCAVIGNASNLLNHNYGIEIDSHDFVIRLNQARVFGYENYVGSKTNLRILNIHSFTSYNGIDNSENKNIFSKFSEDILGELGEMNILAANNADISNAKIKYPNINIVKITDSTQSFIKSVLGMDPTMGFIGLIFALKYFECVSIYGFDFYSGITDHYFEDVIKYDRTSVHDLNNERDIFMYLQNIKRIKFK